MNLFVTFLKSVTNRTFSFIVEHTGLVVLLFLVFLIIEDQVNPLFFYVPGLGRFICAIIMCHGQR
jgi:hypothetical protein